MKNLLVFLKDDEGTTAIEYALVASLIAMAIVGAVGMVGENVVALFDKVVDNWPESG